MAKKLTQDEKPYLTQDGLDGLLERLLPDEKVVKNKKIPSTGCSGRPDFYFPRLSMIVEFDGYQHYSQAKSVLRDRDKDTKMAASGIRAVRIPYFVQWCKEVKERIVAGHLEAVEQTYPHGFIDDKAMLPADFCELGVDRFLKEIDNELLWARLEILASLKNKSTLLGINTVLPPSLHRLIT